MKRNEMALATTHQSSAAYFAFVLVLATNRKPTASKEIEAQTAANAI
jgi:hypothetical protein